MPSSNTFTHSAFKRPFPNDITVPSCTLFAGRDRHSYILSPKSFNNNTSITALVSSFSPINLAGITLVSFKTRVSPLFM